MPLELTLAGLPLLAFRSSPEFHCSGAVAKNNADKSNAYGNILSCGFRPLRRFPGVGQPLIPERNHPFGFGAFSAFLTLSRPSSAQRLPAILGLVPPVGFSLQGQNPPAEHPAFSDGAAFLRFQNGLLCLSLLRV